MADLAVKYALVLDEANEIAKADIKMCMGQNRCGCLGVPPAFKGYEDGIWLADALWSFIDGIVYWITPEESREYLYSKVPGEMGVVPFFAGLQEKTGEHKGNIPIAKYFRKDHGEMGEYEIDYGGMFDLAYVPRRNHRDEVGSGAFLIDAMYQYWKFFNVTSYISEYYETMRDYMEYRLKNIDETTRLFRSTYGIGDVCIDYAVPKCCALIGVNAVCYRMFKRFSEMAEALGNGTDAAKYHAAAKKVRNGINAHLWNSEHNRYEIKMFCSPTTNKESPAYGVTSDDRFFVAGNMMLLYFEIPDSMEEIGALTEEIQKTESGLKLNGQSVEPPYPDGWHNRIFDGGRYWNGDVWPSFASWYAIALFRLGYPDSALDVLKRQAEVAVRDGGFYEFYEDDGFGSGKGAFRYCFTAAPYQRALVEGLFGLDADYPDGKICIHPSLKHSGNISCQLGMHSLDMIVDVDDSANTTELTIETTYSGLADFRILIQDNATKCKTTKDTETIIRCDIKRIGEATYVTFEDKLSAGYTTFNISF